jgi:hypothetical protein
MIAAKTILTWETAPPEDADKQDRAGGENTPRGPGRACVQTRLNHHLV